ncbi:class I SAM-dependent methyltransferase [Pseudonocardia endophytica]|uniref:Ubiquinone/menaquinone biosynthesis C-methylase UbiE n=1 Tax=Pseudonocardia endophytica TaxID=401976 RepID=A0A4R1HR12_PSEEN|nr:class I SAM-dependent methyltransferase [Pseudonocardia endophytica]TCK24578.1 ubiquinone/menaquinone biosynthesis C-methylase UbiE [Pseudonocardia endophytica]
MPDPSAPLTDVTPADATVAAFDTLGLDYERAFRDLPALDSAVERLDATLPRGAAVLDVGSGTGRPVAERLTAAGHRVTGIDVSPRMVEIAREQVPGATFEVADVRTWASPAASWDAVCAYFSVLTMPRPELDATLARITAWLVPGGRLSLATVPVDADGLDVPFLGQPVRAYSYDAETFVDRVRATGLVVDGHEVSTFRPDFPGATPEPHLFLEAHR